MTVKELIVRLEAYPPELLVHGVLGVGQHEEGGVVGVKVHQEAPPVPKVPEPLKTVPEKTPQKKASKHG